MRIAICFSGQLRTAVHAAPAIKRWIGDLWENCDFFIHTWDINTYKGPHGCFYDSVKKLTNITMSSCEKEKFDVPVTETDINLIKNFYEPKFLIIDDYYKIKDYWGTYISENYLQKLNINRNGSHWEALYYSFYRSIELKSFYEEQHNFKYDMVLKMRPDVSYPLHFNLKNEVELFNQDNSKFFIKFDKKDSVIFTLPDFYYANSDTMNIASYHWLSNLRQPNLNIAQYCYNNNIQLRQPIVMNYGFHRLIATDVPSHDWELVDSLEYLYNDPKFFKNNVEPDVMLREKLTNALIQYKVIDNFCKTYGCTYSLG